MTQLSLAFAQVQAQKVTRRQRIMAAQQGVPGAAGGRPPGPGTWLRPEDALARGILPATWINPDGTVKPEFRELAAEAARARRLRAGLQVAS